MNYIILDLEWNQSPSGKENENKDLPFEIIEIGAVKYNENREFVDEFHQLIRPVVYHELHRVTRDLIKISMSDLKKGKPFPVAIKDFFQWCGAEGEYILASWGSMDLTEIQRNCRYFLVEHKFPMPFIYYDIQKLYSLCYDDGKSRLALENAIEALNIEKDIPFHSAVFDAQYTGRIFHIMDFEKVKMYTSVDTFSIPLTRKQEYTINYGTYSKYVSRGFQDKDDMMADPEVLASKCYLCGRSVKKKIRWFSSNQKMYYSLAYCQQHGYLKGKMKVRKSDSDLFFAIKILKLTDEEGAQKIKQKQAATRERRKERRHKEKEKNPD